MSEWILTVGMEVHVELETETKMFCGCKNDPFHSKPNTHVCPVCYGLPGALPLLNKRAIEMTVQLGQALKGKIPAETFWARKNYFYPDLPKGYQISQSTAPLVEDAVVTINGEDHRIERIHLEEDAGKLLHSEDKSHSLVDYNRAGVPLMEIVTHPDFHTAESAKHFCQELQRILRTLKLSSADMEKGRMRCEANISVSQQEGEFGTKVEVKNINSFRAVEKAILYEFDRQTKALEAGETLTQETRTWNDPEGKTVSMRTKETSADYRYFPEPDLPRVKIEIKDFGSVVLPDEQRARLAEIGLPQETIQAVLDKHGFDVVTKLAETSQKVAIEAGKLFLALPNFSDLSEENKIDLISLRDEKGITAMRVKEIVDEALRENKSIREIVESDGGIDLGLLIREVLAEKASIVADYKAGKEAAFNALIGQVMAKSKGRANINQVREELQKALL
jgi:aspartyl-tRNA(Asn)/glutamyl-tRNA(Gln) amidotransferase subunit B